jgi:hypothetical protein
MNLYGGLGAAFLVVSILRIVVLWRMQSRVTKALLLLALIHKQLKGKQC